MTDIITPIERSRIMAAIKSNDTKPEMLVRRFLHGLGFRYGLHNKKLPGSPDIILRKYKTVIFINGCFWHGHENCKYSHIPKSNTSFWQTKIERNKTRDNRNIETLQKLGWNIIVIWECELKTIERREQTFKELIDKLKYSHQQTDQNYSFAAEPETPYGLNM